jgi:hypothetical protein
MSTSSFHLTIRNADPEDFEMLGKLYMSATETDEPDNLDPNIAQDQLWIDIAKPRVANGQDTMLVLERADTKEIIGLAWFRNITQNHNPAPGTPGSSPQGFKTDAKLSAGRVEWQKELSRDFGEFICEYLPVHHSAISNSLSPPR